MNNIFFDIDGTLLNVKKRVEIAHIIASRERKEVWSVIESEELLRLDTLQEGTIETLEHFQSCGWKIYYVTCRREKRACMRQLNDLGIIDYADKLYITTKTVPFNTTGYYVGDTELDIEFAKASGLTPIGITTGSRNREQLELSKPEKIIGGLQELNYLLGEEWR